MALTDWSKYWDDPTRYRNERADGHKVFPGFSLEAVEYLLSRNIVGIGIDTLSPDGSNLDFPIHRAVLGAGKVILENLCSLECLPAVGGTVIALPLKIQDGAEAPCRVVASEGLK